MNIYSDGKIISGNNGIFLKIGSNNHLSDSG